MKVKPKESTRCTHEAKAPRILRFHNELSTDIGGTLRSNVQIASWEDNWKAKQRGVAVFALKLAAFSQDVVRTQGRNYPVVRLPYLSNGRRVRLDSWWVSWYEEWQAMGDGLFSLRSANWTLFCNIARKLEDATMVLRAEWGPMANYGKDNSSAGQPHWHSHPLPNELYSNLYQNDRLDESLADDYVTEAQLQQVPAAIDISGVHLGMAGWQNPGNACWQLSLNKDFLRTIRCWAHRVLLYIQSQLPYARAAYVR